VYRLGTAEADRALASPPDGARVKIVHFMRHGQGFHNLRRTPLDKIVQCNNKDLLDAALTEKGKAEAAKVQDYAANSGAEVVLVSPMRRTLQTATIGFEKANARFIAVEDLREVYGCSSSQRRPTSVARSAALVLSCLLFGAPQRLCFNEDFPGVDFTQVETEEDTRWRPIESPESLNQRQLRFVETLKTRPEKNVGVVTHSLWLLNFFQNAVRCDDDDIKRFFNTGELKSVVLLFPR